MPWTLGKYGPAFGPVGYGLGSSVADTGLGPTPPIPNPALGPVGYGQGPSWKPSAKEKAKAKAKAAKAKTRATISPWDQFQAGIDKYSGELLTDQQKVMKMMLDDQRKRSLSQQAALGGFGEALQGYSKSLWDATAGSYQNAAQQQSAMAAGLGQQVGAGMQAGQASTQALVNALGGGTAAGVTDPGAGQAQVASEGGANTGGMMGAVGTAWGGYGATRPDAIGFMTGQNQQQLAREAQDDAQEIRMKFAEMALQNPKDAAEMWSLFKTNQREDVSTSLARKTLATNIAMQKAKIQQTYQQMVTDAKTTAAKLKADNYWKKANLDLDKQVAGWNYEIDQGQLDVSEYTAASGRINANAAMVNANKPPTPRAPRGYEVPGYQAKIGLAMEGVPNLLSGLDPTMTVRAKTDVIFRNLWPQMEPYVDAKNRERARKVLKGRIWGQANLYKPKPSGDAGRFGQKQPKKQPKEQ